MQSLQARKGAAVYKKLN